MENHEFRLHPVDRFALRQVPSQVGFFFGSMLAYVLIFVLQTTGVAFSLVMVVLAIVVTTGIASIFLTKDFTPDYNSGLAHAVFYACLLYTSRCV